MPSSAIIGKSYELLKDGSTAAYPALSGLNELPVLASPDVSSHAELASPRLKEFKVLCRGFRTKPTFPPNWNVCEPFVHERSSTKLWTGIWKLSERIMP